ncbi:hypothetical protein PoB_001551700 [Plakobranchus ocellatus]|uniref:Uncharacterized protein n=1 Tax=Plakobranchus ocellatus TaxID=259542 RepID=A0AAV3Z1E4_9GAST|nr:hypothetical protein PoB_001551700 [Plakobranchus ocellatus]
MCCHVYLYTHDETVAKRGDGDLCSLLLDFVTNQLSEDVREIIFFCHGCSGQNKNYVVVRLMYQRVHHMSRLSSVKMFFPMKGHAYVESDWDFADVNCKKNVGTCLSWRKTFTFQHCKCHVFHVWRLHIHLKLPVHLKTGLVREIHLVNSHPRLIMFRDTWNGGFESAVLTKPGNKIARIQQLQHSYCIPLPISCEKSRDLQVLKRFCNPANHGFFNALP